eukprot:3365918-Pyramimonas_sp.AAC.1
MMRIQKAQPAAKAEDGGVVAHIAIIKFEDLKTVCAPGPSCCSWRAMACLLLSPQNVLKAKFRIFSPDLNTWISIYPTVGKAKSDESKEYALVEDMKLDIKDAISYYRYLDISIYRAIAESPKGQELPDDCAVHREWWIYVKTIGEGYWD